MYVAPHETVALHVPAALFLEYMVPLVFDPLHATCGLLLVSVDTVGMKPGEASSTFVTTAQFAAEADWGCVGYATVVFVYRTRFIDCWLPAAEADTQTTWRKPPESIAIDGSVESRASTSGLSPGLPDARMIWLPQVDPLVSKLRMRTIRSQ